MLLFLPLVAAQTLSGAVVQHGKGLNLPQGDGSIYLYGMGTGGARRAKNFVQGPYAQVVNQRHQVVAGLALTPSSTNSFWTDCADFTIAGVAVSGFKAVSSSYAANNQRNASSVADSFSVTDPAVVVVVAIAGGEDHIQLQGLPSMQIDAPPDPNQSNGTAIMIAHASLPPGHYTVAERTIGKPGRDPFNEGDLLGVFVFTDGAGITTPLPAEKTMTPSAPPAPTPVVPAPIPPTSATLPQTPMTQPPAATESATRSATEGTTVTVPGQAGPWDLALNPTLRYGYFNQGPPAVVSEVDGAPLTPGIKLTLTYVGGTVGVGRGWLPIDANGVPGHALISNRGLFPSRYLEAGGFPVNIGALMGAFAVNGVIIGRPFKVGDGPLTAVVPAGANQLLLGVNDDNFADHSGTWIIRVAYVKESKGSHGSSAKAIGLGFGCLVLIAAGMTILLVWRRTASQKIATSASLSGPPLASSPQARVAPDAQGPTPGQGAVGPIPGGRGGHHVKEGSIMRDFLTFRRMITPIIIQIVFWLGVIGCVIAGIGMMITAMGTKEGLNQAFPQMPGQAGAASQALQVLMGLAIIVFGPLVCRIYCELLILLFRMNESLADIKHSLAKSVGA